MDKEDGFAGIANVSLSSELANEVLLPSDEERPAADGVAEMSRIVGMAGDDDAGASGVDVEPARAESVAKVLRMSSLSLREI